MIFPGPGKKDDKLFPQRLVLARRLAQLAQATTGGQELAARASRARAAGSQRLSRVLAGSVALHD